MFSKIRNTMLALAAIASLGVATLVTSTSSADARGFGGGFSRGGGHMGGGMHMGGGRNFGGQRFVGHRGFGGRGFRHVGIRHHNWCRFNGRCGVHVRWHRPWIYTAPVATGYAVTPSYAAPRCTCLTKEYTQDNQVVFQDVCTKEIASAPAGMPQDQTQVQQPTQPQVR